MLVNQPQDSTPFLAELGGRLRNERTVAGLDSATLYCKESEKIN